jgi:formylglycine-generating enzyme required for sulfatase activity
MSLAKCPNYDRGPPQQCLLQLTSRAAIGAHPHNHEASDVSVTIRSTSSCYTAHAWLRWKLKAGVLTPVGAYCSDDQVYNSASYYGTCDQGGLLWEWTEAAYPLATARPNRIVRGGSWGPGITPLQKTIRRDYGPMGTIPLYYNDDTVFRLAKRSGIS